MQSSILARSVVALLATALLCAFAAPAVAQEEEFYYKRQMGEQYTDESAWLVSASHTPEGSDWVIFGINTVGDDEKGLGIGVIYGHGTVANMNDWAAATFLAPYGLVEYKDNGDGRYDLRGDTVVSVLPLHKDLRDSDDFYEQTGSVNGSVKWYDRPGYKPLGHSTQSVLKVKQVTLEAQTTDGVFTIVMHVSNSIFINETVVLSPYEIKIDFVIEDYPYVAEDTELALLSIVAVGNAEWNQGLPTDYKEEWQSYKEEDGMNFPIEGGAGYFSWAKEADVDGTNQSVTASTLAQFSEFNWTPNGTTAVGVKWVAMSYGRGDKITHDPKLGYVFKNGIPPGLERIVKGSGGAFLLGIVLFAAVVGTARYVRSHGSTPKRARPPTGGAPPQQQQYPQYAQQRVQQLPQEYNPPQGPQASQPGAQAPGAWGVGQQPQQPPRQSYRPPAQ